MGGESFYGYRQRGAGDSFSIDGWGNLVAVTSPDECVTTLVYDNQHLLQQWQNPQGDITLYGYDCCRRLTSVLTPQNELTQFQYPNSQTRLIIDPRSNCTTLTLDTYGNVGSVMTPEGILTTYVWDNKQQLLSITDGRNYTTNFTYTGLIGNNVQRLATIQKPEGGVLSFEYDSTARPTQIVDENGNCTTLPWDGPVQPHGAAGRHGTDDRLRLQCPRAIDAAHRSLVGSHHLDLRLAGAAAEHDQRRERNDRLCVTTTTTSCNW